MVATVLLGSALVVQLCDPGAWAINPFFSLIGLTYAVSLGFIGSLRFVDCWPWLTDVYFAIDAVIISAAIMLSGGVDSLFTGLVLLQYLYAADNIALPLNPSKADLPPANVASDTGPGVNFERHLQDIERSHLERALDQSGGVQTKAADVLGLSFRQVRYLAKNYGLK